MELAYCKHIRVLFGQQREQVSPLMQVAQVVAQALRQADTDVAIEAWADRSAEPRDIARLMAEVQFTAYIAVRDIAVLKTMCFASAVPFTQGLRASKRIFAMWWQQSCTVICRSF